jgi:hypothetical protein
MILKVEEQKLFAITIRTFSALRVKRIQEKPKMDPRYNQHPMNVPFLWKSTHHIENFESFHCKS